jgi:hypothetical protein
MLFKRSPSWRVIDLPVMPSDTGKPLSEHIGTCRVRCLTSHGRILIGSGESGRISVRPHENIDIHADSRDVLIYLDKACVMTLVIDG